MKKVLLKDLPIDEVVKKLQEGKTLKEKESDTYVKVVNGVICTFYENGDIGINDNIIFNIKDETSMYFEEPEEFKLEVGKRYRTRDERQAYIYRYDGFKFHGVIINSPSFFEWFENGTYNYNGKESTLDIISEWSDDDVAED